jgi:hypothetical protein
MAAGNRIGGTVTSPQPFLNDACDMLDERAKQNGVGAASRSDTRSAIRLTRHTCPAPSSKRQSARAVANTAPPTSTHPTPQPPNSCFNDGVRPVAAKSSSWKANAATNHVPASIGARCTREWGARPRSLSTPIGRFGGRMPSKKIALFWLWQSRGSARARKEDSAGAACRPRSPTERSSSVEPLV